MKNSENIPESKTLPSKKRTLESLQKQYAREVKSGRSPVTVPGAVPADAGAVPGLRASRKTRERPYAGSFPTWENTSCTFCSCCFVCL